MFPIDSFCQNIAKQSHQDLYYQPTSYLPLIDLMTTQWFRVPTSHSCSFLCWDSPKCHCLAACCKFHHLVVKPMTHLRAPNYECLHSIHRRDIPPSPTDICYDRFSFLATVTVVAVAEWFRTDRNLVDKAKPIYPLFAAAISTCGFLIWIPCFTQIRMNLGSLSRWSVY